MIEQEHTFRELMDAIPVLVWITGPGGEATFFNRATMQYTGCTMEALLGDRWLEALHPDDREPTATAWANALARGEDFTARFRIRNHAGDYRWMMSHGYPQRDGGGRVLRWYGSTVDVHDAHLLQQASVSLGKQFNQTLDSISDGFVLLDRAGMVQFANEAFRQLLAISPDLQCEGRMLTAILPPSAARTFATRLDTVNTDNPESDGRVYLPDTGLWCDLRIFVYDEGLVISLRDVTEVISLYQLQRVEADALLKLLSNGPLAEILETILHGIEALLPDCAASILLLDDSGRHVRHGAAPSLPDAYNRAIDGLPIGPRAGSCGTAAYRREPVIVTDIATDPLWQDYKAIALEHGLRACWSTPVRNNGDVLGTFAIYHHAPKAPAQRDLDLIQRVSHLAGVAIQAHRQEQALRESETRFQQLAATIDDIFWMEDLTREAFIYVSPAFERITGYSADLLQGRSDAWLALVDDDERPRLAEAHWRRVEDPYNLTYSVHFADGSRHWVNDRAYLVRDDQGRPWRLIGVIRDITEQVTMERELRDAQRMESLGQLTGGVAHDFNNLLTVILGNAELLVELLQDQPRLKSLAAMVETAAQRGADLTQRLLAFAQRQSLDPKPVNLRALIDEMKPLLERTLGQHISINVHHGDDLSSVMVDRGQMENALLNLCINARDAMADGGRLTIEARNRTVEEGELVDLAPGNYVQLSVSDTGTGISPETIEHVFDPFFTTKSKDKGTGLGLAMVYGFVRQSLGHIQVYSEPGIGSVFHLYLPATGAEACVNAVIMEEIPVKPDRDEWILLVEDNELVREHVRNLVEGFGYRVLEAGNGAEALSILAGDNPVDLLFTDVVMPGGINGPQLVDQARKLRTGLKVLFTSGYTENAMHATRRPEGGLLSKPYSRTELQRKLRLALDGAVDDR